MKKLGILIVAIFLYGCATQQINAKLQVALAPAENTNSSIVCNDECEKEWQRAQIWVARHSNMKLQIISDVLIHTFNPPENKQWYGFLITKEPSGKDEYNMQISMICGNRFGCEPEPDKVRNAFNFYIKTGEDLLTGQGYLSAIK